MAETSYAICTLPGDGIGPEIMAEAKKVLAAVGARCGVRFACEDHLIGGAAIDATRAAVARGEDVEVTALPEETLAAARAADAVLLASVGGPAWDTTDADAVRPEQGLLGIRKGLGVYLNLRPVHVYRPLVAASPLKPELLEGVDLLIVRELTGGLYFGKRGRTRGAAGEGSAAGGVAAVAGPAGGARAGGASEDGAVGEAAFDTMEYSAYEIERVVRWAFEEARRRGGRVASVDKANVLETSRLWREVTHRVAADFSDVPCEDVLVDNCAMQLMIDPSQYDVLVTENTFGDILSDEASVLSGSLGMLASASLGDGTALFEPCHGSAPDIVGTGVANPLAQILSVELMLRHSLGMREAADAVGGAVGDVIDAGWRTPDIAADDTPAERLVGTARMGDLVVEALAERLGR